MCLVGLWYRWAHRWAGAAAGLPCAGDAADACPAGEACATYIDGYYAVCWLCFLVGGLLLERVVRPRVTALQTLPEAAWRTGRA